MIYNAFFDHNSWKQLCDMHFKEVRYTPLVLGVAPFAFKTASTLLGMLSTSLWHSCSEMASHFTCTLSHNTFINVRCCELLIEDTPEMLNGVEIWRLRGPVHDLYLVLFEAPFGVFASMFGVLVLLEGDVVGT